MDTLLQALEYALDPHNNFVGKLVTHLELSGLSLLAACALGIPLGIWTSKHKRLAQLVMNLAGVLRVVPPIAVLFLLLPVFKIGFWAPVVALTLLALPPLLINTDAGMRGVDPGAVEAGRGMGMSSWRLLARVQLPLSLPVILAGLQIAGIEVVASATLAVLIGGGGLGEYIATGLALNRSYILLVGAVPVAAIALSIELGLAYLRRVVLRREHIEAQVVSRV
ncbi:MAG: ABC transporter permease [Chloroflexota bacterium]|nr:ABC transporter permease [Chloroflexota bacterium]MDQ5864713.1 ABC transporter permease [Chloroflexota bacterium]